MTPIAQDHVVVYESPDPARVFCYSPGLAVVGEEAGVSSNSGRLIATMDLGGPGVGDLPGVKAFRTSERGTWQGKVFISDDKGRTWRHTGDFPFMHARPFLAGESLYVLGQAGDLIIIRSDDGGETWTEPVLLTEGQSWHQAPSNVLYANGCIYLVMERRTREVIEGWPVGDFSPVLMRARDQAGVDLTRAENWTFADELSFYQALPEVEQDGAVDFVGIPFYSSDFPRGAQVGGGRRSSPMGWLETNVVRFVDPNHIWHDSSGKTFHLWMRAQIDGTGYACVARVQEEGETPGTGAMHTTLQKAPSGKTCLYVPCPGGQLKFHVLYDQVSGLYWLLSSQATDSMTAPDRLSPDRYGMPYNQRRRLQLHFSRNMVDWCFAALVAVGPGDNASRHYASMAIDGEDLHILSRSGDERAKSAHDGNLITFHSIPEFRRLVY